MVKLRREVQLQHASHLVVDCFWIFIAKMQHLEHIRKLAHRKGLFSKVAYPKSKISPFVPHHGSRRYKTWKYSITPGKCLIFDEAGNNKK